jgi:hypothetical protein
VAPLRVTLTVFPFEQKGPPAYWMVAAFDGVTETTVFRDAEPQLFETTTV